MDCERCREALSALADEEVSEVERRAVRAHIGGCAACAAYGERLAEVTRMLRVREAVAVPDLSADILLQIGAVRPRQPRDGWLRVGLALLAAVQLAFALPDLLGAGGHAHQLREVASWHLGLAVGFAVVAWRPVRAQGLVPAVAAAAAALIVTAGIDVWTGGATLLSESQHLLKVAGLALLWAVGRHRPAGPLRPQVA